MLRILKRFYPFREIARIIDLHFQRLDDFSRSLVELQNFQNVEGHEIAENQTAVLQALTFTVERLQQQHAALEQLEGRHAKDAEDLASPIDRLQQQQTALERLEGGQTKSAEVLPSVVERQQQQQAVLERLGREVAESQTAVLQALTFTVERLQEQHAVLERIEDSRLRDADSYQRMEHTLAALAANLAALKDEAHTSQNREGLERALDRQTELVTQVQSQLADTKAIFENELVRQVYVESDDYDAVNPETGLLTFLYSHLPTRKALDVGAHVGDVSERLLSAGYEVYAFEPAPAVYEKLKQKLEGRKDFTAFQLALGSSEGEALLHFATDLSEAKYYEDPTLLSSLVTHSMPADIPFTDTVPVLVKTISELHRSGLVPEDIALVKIDTEGFDLEVIRGMGDHRYPVVAAEYFDVRNPFGQSGLLYTLDTLVWEMRNRGYLWHIVMHRDWHCKHTAYYCNHELAVPGTWGNAIFFRDHGIFWLAQSWCSAVLPRTYFKPVRSAAVKDLQRLTPDRIPSA